MQVKIGKTIIRMNKTEIRCLSGAADMMEQISQFDNCAKEAGRYLRIVISNYGPVKREVSGDAEESTEESGTDAA